MSVRRASAALVVALLTGCTSSGGGRAVSGPLPPSASPNRAAVPPAKVAVRGDVTGDGRADVVVAARRRTTVYVLPGGGGRPGVVDWSGNGRAGVFDPISELAAADFNGDGRADVALGTPNHRDPAGRAGGGRVTVLYGMPVAPYLDTRRPVVLDEDHPSLLHPGDRRPRFGGLFDRSLPVTAASLGLPPGNRDTIESALLDIDGDGRAQLLAGVRYIGGGTRPDEIHLLSARLTEGGTGAVKDLTGLLRDADVGGEGPGGEFIR